MNEFQAKQLVLLKDFIRVCEKHHLRYYLFGGTLLGAVRHGGFIPWDDDIDVAMPRPDFDQLMKLKAEFFPPFFLQNYHTDPSYTYTFAKLRDSSTTFIEAVFAMHNFNHGIYIDIFPLDGATRRPNARKTRSLKPVLMWVLWWFTYLGHYWHRPSKKNWWYCGFAYLISTVFLPFNLGNWLTRLMHRWAKAIPFEQASLIGPYHTMYFNQDTFPKAWFSESAPGTFEGVEVHLPIAFDQYLQRIYGDYTKLPPMSKQVGTHLHIGKSTTIGYRDFDK